ncbi:OV-16 antigen-like isoform X2 [Bemisia tabaci]|uniref:OV-16 antigen-like isoform X2 n=1 Tax=Bemisia tabaci TaxID=7038 RepID=UPI003B280884
MKLHITFVWLFLTIRLVKLTEVPLTSTWYPAFDVLLRDPKDIETDLKRWRIIPDLLDEAPKEAVQVEWIEGLEPLFGNEINSTITKREPFWTCWNSNETEFYTMIFTGIDEKLKAQTSYGEKQFWIVGNIRDYEFLGGEFLTEYMGPDPPEGKGKTVLFGRIFPAKPSQISTT